MPLFNSFMLIGYARVSTRDQHLNLQQDALRAAGCEKIFLDEVSGTVASRPGLDKLKEQLRPGDTLVENFARPESFSGVDDDIITFLIILLS